MSVECPYCEHEFEVCQDDGFGTDENETYEQECPKCEKAFALTVSISFNYSGTKADCMNDGEHNFREDKYLAPWTVGKERCKSCGQEITVDKEAHDKAMAEYFKSLKSSEATQ
jgi:hypothetical protein